MLALQGSFPLHARALERCGATTREVRRPADLDGLEGLVLPGGESTTLSLLAREYDLFEPLREAASELPMFGTCAGAVFLGTGSGQPPRLGVVPVESLRNAYGRQVDSFTAELELRPFAGVFHGIFIRAPRLRVSPRNGVDVLGSHHGDPVLVRSGRHLVSTFHPELTDDLRIHRLFLDGCRGEPQPADGETA